MRELFMTIALLSIYNTVSAQFIATVEMKEPLEGICNHKEVYALFPGFTGQQEAKCAVSEEEILKMLNEIPFLKENPNYKDKGMVGFYVNCEGEMIECEMDGNSTKSKVLDEQIISVFKKLDSWETGKLNGKEVDSRMLYSFEIKKGKLIFP